MPESAYTRFAHCEGFVPVCHVPDGAGHFLMATVGCDGELRLWSDINDDEPRSHRLGDTLSALCVQQTGDGAPARLLVGTDYNAAAAFLLPGVQPDGVVTRLTAPLTDLSARGQRVAVAGCDMHVRVLSQEGTRQLALPEAKAPVLCAQLAPPGGSTLLTAGCDGAVAFWDVSGAAATLLARHENVLPKCNDVETSATRVRCDWHRGGKVAAVPVGKEVRLYSEKSRWQESGRLSGGSELSAELAACVFSPCGQLVVACSLSGQLLRWQLPRGSCQLLHQCDQQLPLLCLSWHPRGHLLAFTDSTGQLGVLDPRGSQHQEPLSATGSAQQLLDLDSLEQAIDDDDEEDNDLLEAAMKQDRDFNDDPAADDDDDDDDENTISLRKLKAGAEHKTDTVPADADSATVARADDVIARPSRSLERPLQAPFQPGSTPEHLESRFLVWNHVGAVVGHSGDEGAGGGSIDVEFHDSGVHHALHMANVHGHTLAALSETALLLAAPPSHDPDDQPTDDLPAEQQQEEEGRALLQCLLLAPLDPSEREWTLRLSAGERAVGVCVGDAWLAVTSTLTTSEAPTGPGAWRLRVFSLAGVQLHVMSLCGVPLCVSARGRFMLLLQRSACGSCSLCVWSVSLDAPSLSAASHLSQQPLPVPAGVQVCWAGLSEDTAAPCIMDSRGVLHVLTTGGGGAVWTPLVVAGVDGRRQHLFVASVSEASGEVSGVLCRGSRYPAVLPPPVLARLALSVPLCDGATERGRLEQQAALARWQTGACPGAEGAHSRSLAVLVTKLFALACKSQQQQRALELAHQLASQDTLRALTNYANKQRLPRLVQLLVQLMDSRQQQQQQQLEEESLAAEQESASQYSVDMFSSAPAPNSHSDHDRQDEEECEENQLRLPAALPPPAPPVRSVGLLSSTPASRNPFRCSAPATTPRPSTREGPRGAEVFDNIRTPVLGSSANKRPLADFELKPAKIKRPHAKKNTSL